MNTPTESATQEGELLPCPFCGSNNCHLEDLAGYEVTCYKCGCNICPIDAQRESAIRIWNRRAPQPPVTKDAPAPAQDGVEPVAILVREIGEDDWFDHKPLRPTSKEAMAVKGSAQMDYCEVYSAVPTVFPKEAISQIVKRLRDTPNWLRESFADWKSCVTKYDRTPFDAADLLEKLASPPLQPTPTAQPVIGCLYVEPCGSTWEVLFRYPSPINESGGDPVIAAFDTEAEALAFLESYRTAQPNGDKS